MRDRKVLHANNLAETEIVALSWIFFTVGFEMKLRYSSNILKDLSKSLHNQKVQFGWLILLMPFHFPLGKIVDEWLAS